MNDLDSANEVLIHCCPDCGGHLADTWDPKDDECGRCGFQYVAVRARGSKEMAASRLDDPLAKFKATVAGTAALFAAMVTGGLVSSAEIVTETSDGAIQFHPPGDAFFGGVAVFVVAFGLLTYAITRREIA